MFCAVAGAAGAPARRQRERCCENEQVRNETSHCIPTFQFVACLVYTATLTNAEGAHNTEKHGGDNGLLTLIEQVKAALILC